MRIRELQLIRYGKFTDRTVALPQQEQDIHIVVGPNESGKSTLRAAIGEWLFGMPARSPMGFLHPMPDLRLGGVLEMPTAVGEALQQLAFERKKGSKHTLRQPGSDDVLPDAVLQPWLGSMQAEGFERMHALDHSKLLAGGEAILSASSDLGRMLFQSAAGVQHLGRTLQQLDKEAGALWGPRKANSRKYYQALEAYEAANTQLNAVMLRTKAWRHQQSELNALAQALAQAKAQQVDLQEQAQQLARIRRVWPWMQALTQARAEHMALLADGEVPDLPAHATQRLQAAQQDQAVLHADEQRLQQVQAELLQAQQAISLQPDLLARADAIAALNERRVQLQPQRRHVQQLQAALDRAWGLAQAQAQALHWPHASEAALRNRLPDAALREALAVQVKAHADLTFRLQAMQAQVRASEAQSLQLAQALAHDARDVEAQSLRPVLQQLSEVQRELLARRARLQALEEELTQWQAAWQRTAQAVGHDAQRPVAELEAALPLMHRLDVHLSRMQGIREACMAEMQRDLAAFARDAAALAQQLAPDLSGGPEADHVALALQQRLNQALSDAAWADAVAQQLARTQADLQAVASRQAQIDARMAPLLAQAGVMDWQALQHAIARAEQARVLADRLQAAEAALQQAGDGLSEAELREACDSLPPPALQLAQTALEQALSENVERIAELSAQHAVQQHSLAAFNGSDAAAVLAAQRQEAMADMAEAAEHYLRLRTEAALLRWGMAQFRATQQAPMLAKASAMFKTLSLGAFERLLVNEEATSPELQGVRPDGRVVAVSGMSEGTRDQLYLALRLAALSLQSERGHCMPLIADDVFINFDDARVAACLQVLGELSRQMQVIVLTHHAHLLPMARDVLGAQLNVVQL